MGFHLGKQFSLDFQGVVWVRMSGSKWVPGQKPQMMVLLILVIIKFYLLN